MKFDEMQRAVYHVDRLNEYLEHVESLIMYIDECDDKAIYDAAIQLQYDLTVKIRLLMGADAKMRTEERAFAAIEKRGNYIEKRDDGQYHLAGGPWLISHEYYAGIDELFEIMDEYYHGWDTAGGCEA